MLISMRTPQNATVFEYIRRDFDFETGNAVFTYRVHFDGEEALEFKEVVTVSNGERAKKLPDPFLTRMLEDLHLVLGISYYKLFCPSQLSGYPHLARDQADFWNTLYLKGLGEFLYRNTLHPSVIARFSVSEEAALTPAELQVSENSVLIGIGGGKDSIVSLELLKACERTGFVVETGKGHDITNEVAEIAEVPLAKISRTLDPQLIAGVPQSYNGHVPVSAIYAFLGIFEAALSGSAYVVVSNEHSSNFGNVEYEGVEVNHKWSGSVEFELLMQKYVRENLTTNIRYFSLTRPFYELRVVKLFTQLGEKYFHAFSSCNRNFTHHHDGKSKWCGECPKCAFGFLMLAAFLPKETVVGIFKKDLFEDQALVPLYRDLLGFGTLKPFDCVGTFEESLVALRMAANNGWGDSYVVATLISLLANSELSDEVMKVQKAETVPSRFRLLGMESVLILGYGKEGRAAWQYIEQHFPRSFLGKADAQEGEEYIEKQHEYDITIKSPAIPKELVTRQGTTATQLFFTEVPRTQIIGVTGSKGKSTTSSLIHELLTKAGVRSRLVGNIGIQALASIQEKPAEPDEIFVFELSSYQLEDLDVSPHIAVVTSLFPEHLDHHGSLEAYYEAKRSIIAAQTPGDVFACHLDMALPKSWVRCVVSERIPTQLLPFTITNASLRGEHNLRNAVLAFTVAHLFGVSAAHAEAAFAEYKGLPHRLQHFGTFKEIDFYDDSISTTPESSIAGIRALQNVDTIILGGVDRGYNFTELENELKAQGIRNVVLFPESGEHMLASEEGFNVLHTTSMDEAVQFAYANTQKGKVCLLSPAAPSYNLFTNFEERGEAFKNAVKKFA